MWNRFSFKGFINDVGVAWAWANQKAPLATLIGWSVNRFITRPLSWRGAKVAFDAKDLKVHSWWYNRVYTANSWMSLVVEVCVQQGGWNLWVMTPRWIPNTKRVQRRDFPKAMNFQIELFFGKRTFLFFSLSPLLAIFGSFPFALYGFYLYVCI